MILLKDLLTKGNRTRLENLRITNQRKCRWICMTDMQKITHLKMVLGEFRTLTSKISIIKVDSSFSWMVHVMCTRWATY